MSTVTISYSDIKNASNEAKAVSRKLSDYADELNKLVYKKLVKYDGEHNHNINSAKTYVTNKINSLESNARKYSTYATNLNTLKTNCSNTDRRVARRVASLTAAFKANHGIRNNPIENARYRFITKVNNSTAAGRWVSDKMDQYENKKRQIKDAIKEWYNYEGGKELIKGVLVAVLEIVGGVLAVIVAFTTGGILIGIIAGAIAGVFTALNGIANLVNEMRAYSDVKNGDPASARRKSNLNTVTDTIRTECDSKGVHIFSKVLDGISFVANITNLACAGYKLISKGPAWVKNGIEAIKKLDFSHFGKTLEGMKSAFRMNLKAEFLNFENLEKGAKSWKNIVDVGKLFAKGEYGKMTFRAILPGIGKFGNVDLTANNFYSFGTSTINNISSFKKLLISVDTYNVNVEMDMSIMDKLSSVNSIDISIPDIYIPNTSHSFAY